MLISIIYKGTSVDYAIENYTLNQYEKHMMKAHLIMKKYIGVFCSI